MVSKLQAESSELKQTVATTHRDTVKYEHDIADLKQQLQQQTALTSTLKSELDAFTGIKLKQNLIALNTQNWENFNSQQQKTAQQVKTDLSELETKLTRVIGDKLLDAISDTSSTASLNANDLIEQQSIRLREFELEMRDTVDTKLSKFGRDVDTKYGTYINQAIDILRTSLTFLTLQRTCPRPKPICWCSFNNWAVNRPRCPTT